MSRITGFLILTILVLSIFFRFYNSANLQYWSGDEEIASALVRRMIFEKKIALVSPNATIASSLGSFFHILSVPLFLLSQMNPVSVLLLSSLLGVATSILLFYFGRIVKDNRFGFIISFLYSGSFLSSLFDRRWWPLSFNTFLTTVALISIYKIMVKKKYFFSVPLAVTIGFAGHADPSLGVILIATLFSFMYIRPKIFRKEYIFALITLFTFVLPLLIFEARHRGVVFNPLVQALSRGSSLNTQLRTDLLHTDILPATAARLFLSQSSKYAENNFCYCKPYDPPLFGTSSKILIGLFLIVPLYFLIRSKNTAEKQFLVLLYLYASAFMAGSLMFTMTYQSALHQHYFTIIFPLIFCLIGYSIYKLTYKKPLILIIILGFYLVVNGKTLLNSQFRYPLSQKVHLVKNLSDNIKDKNFSLFVSDDPYIHGGGFTGLFILENKHPKKSYVYPFYDWMYRSHSLYTVTPEDNNQELVVIIAEAISINNPEIGEKINYRERIGNLEGIILNNSPQWFNEGMLNKEINFSSAKEILE